MAVTLNANTSTGFIATSDTSGVLQLQTAGTTAVTVDASQNVGIGTASPTYKLDVTGSMRVVGSVGSYTFDGSGARLNFTRAGTNYIEASNAAGTLSFGTGGQDTNRLYIDASGNVGIGTNGPAQKLQVNGKAIIGTYAGTGAYGLYLRSDAESTHYNWQISTQNTVNGAVEFARSTAVGGSTFNSPSVVIDLNGNLQFNSGYGSAATAYGCRAWVNFNGTGTPAIRASGNVSSITDNGTGDYTANFTSSIVDANYSAVFSASGTIGGSTNALAAAPVVWATTSIRLRTMMSGVYYDSDVCGAIFR